MENAKTLKSELEALGHNLSELECNIERLKRRKYELYSHFFYAVNEMEFGQPFRFMGEIYYRVEGYDNCVKDYSKTKKGLISTKGKWIYCSEYKEIEPLPKGNSKNDE